MLPLKSYARKEFQPIVSSYAHDFISLEMPIHVHVYVGTMNSTKLKAIKNAVEDVFMHPISTITPMNVSSDVKSQPIGLDETRLGAINRMRKCVQHPVSKQITLSFGIENGLVSGLELSTFFPTEYSKNHWYDIGVVASTLFKNGLKFTYLSYATPLQIPNTETDGLLPPGHLDGLDSSIKKYQSVILPLLHKNIDLYHYFSQGQVSREGQLFKAAKHAIERLANIKVYGFDHPKVQTVILFGTFDLFHDMHKRLIRRAFEVCENLAVFVNNQDKKKKDNGYLMLKDNVQDRLTNVSQYALKALPKGSKKNVDVCRMPLKHCPSLKHAIQKHSIKGSVAVFGGEDQFENFHKVLDLCYNMGTPIIAINRGDNLSLCSSDIRTRYSYKRMGDIYDIDLVRASTKIWKARLNSLGAAKAYLKKLPFLGAEKAEIWKYTKTSFMDRKINKPVVNRGKIIVCLPGRTKCDIDRMRKILLTIGEMMDVDRKVSLDLNYYGLCYQEIDKTSEYYITELENNPYGYFSDDAMLVTKTILMPRVSDQIVIKKVEDRWIVHRSVDYVKRPFHEIMNGLAEITFSARSRGSVLALEIENAFRFCMLALEYDEEEIEDFGNQIAVLNVSNIASLDRGRLFSTISFTGINDKRAMVYIKSLAEWVSHCYHKGSECTLKSLSRSHLVIFSKIPQIILTHAKNSDPNTDIITISDKDCHYTPLYISQRIGGNNTIPNLVTHVFQKMVQRPPLFVLQQFALHEV